MTSNQQVPADAGGMPITRRAILGTGTTLLAVGAARMAASQTMPAEVPVPESAELNRLIKAHRQARAAWIAAEDLADDAQDGDGLRHAASRAAKAEKAAFMAVIAYPMSSLADVRTIVAFAREAWWDDDGPEDDELTAFFGAIMGGGA